MDISPFSYPFNVFIGKAHSFQISNRNVFISTGHVLDKGFVFVNDGLNSGNGLIAGIFKEVCHRLCGVTELFIKLFKSLVLLGYLGSVLRAVGLQFGYLVIVLLNKIFALFLVVAELE